MSKLVSNFLDALNDNVKAENKSRKKIPKPTLLTQGPEFPTKLDYEKREEMMKG